MKIAAQRFAILGCSAVVVAACWWSPDVALPAIAPAVATAGRAWAYSASIVLGASPYILVGALFATIAARVSLPPIAAALLAMVSPACDCAMNGYARIFLRAPAFVAGFALVWAASCNPVALLATHAILGRHIMMTRIAATAATGVLTSAAWTALGKRGVARDHAQHPCDASSPIHWTQHFTSGLLWLFPAAALAGLLVAVAPHALQVRSTPLVMALAGAIASPCSTADAVLARVLSSTHAGQAAFVLAAQTLDVRQLSLIGRTFGTARMIAAACAAIVGCCIGAAIA